MTATSCPACGNQVREGARFCDNCGSPMVSTAESAEYKQVTVLFADVVGSTDIIAAVGAERLREIMAGLVKKVGCGGAALRWHGRQLHR